MIRRFTTSKTRLTIVVEELRNGSCVAYVERTQEEGGNVQILHSWSLDWLLDTLRMRYLGETLIQEL